MRITQMTQAFIPFPLALLVLQHLATAMPHQESRLHTQRKRLSCIGMDQMDDVDDSGGGGSSSGDTGGDFNSCKSNNQLRHRDSKQTATNIAQKAAHEAEQAYSTQQSAAAEVSHMVKKQLADRAYAAARAAEAALSGKQQMLEQLESEISQAESTVQQQADSVLGTQNNLNAASMSAKDAQMLFLSLQKAIALAQENLNHANVAASGAQHELEEKTQILELSQNRVDVLKKRLTESRKELQNIKKSAYKAVCAAAEARKKSRDRRSAIGEVRLKRLIKRRIKQLQQQQEQPQGQPQQQEQLHSSGVLY